MSEIIYKCNLNNRKCELIFSDDIKEKGVNSDDLFNSIIDIVFSCLCTMKKLADENKFTDKHIQTLKLLLNTQYSKIFMENENE